jgi:hypothetical protein
MTKECQKYEKRIPVLSASTFFGLRIASAPHFSATTRQTSTLTSSAIGPIIVEVTAGDQTVCHIGKVRILRRYGGRAWYGFANEF